MKSAKIRNRRPSLTLDAYKKTLSRKIRLMIGNVEDAIQDVTDNGEPASLFILKPTLLQLASMVKHTCEPFANELTRWTEPGEKSPGAKRSASKLAQTIGAVASNSSIADAVATAVSVGEKLSEALESLMESLTGLTEADYNKTKAKRAIPDVTWKGIKASEAASQVLATMATSDVILQSLATQAGYSDAFTRAIKRQIMARLMLESVKPVVETEATEA